ncbi:hypothetical protein D3C80_1515440 [compost metagenome]
MQHHPQLLRIGRKHIIQHTPYTPHGCIQRGPQLMGENGTRRLHLLFIQLQASRHAVEVRAELLNLKRHLLVERQLYAQITSGNFLRGMCDVDEPTGQRAKQQEPRHDDNGQGCTQQKRDCPPVIAGNAGKNVIEVVVLTHVSPQLGFISLWILE